MGDAGMSKETSELLQWMIDNEDKRHEIRDLNIPLLQDLTALIIFGGPKTLVQALKMALYAGYRSAEKQPNADVPDVFKSAFKDDEPKEGKAGA